MRCVLSDVGAPYRGIAWRAVHPDLDGSRRVRGGHGAPPEVLREMDRLADEAWGHPVTRTGFAVEMRLAPAFKGRET